MGKLVFFDEGHQYQLDGETIPSVSEVTRFMSREVYGEVNKEILEKACIRGTKVHEACEELDRKGTVECDSDIEGYVQAYLKWRKDKGIKQKDILEIEQAYADKELQYAGTLDRIIMYNGKRCLMDIKSASGAQKRLWLLGVNAYKILWEKNHPNEKIDLLLDLQLKKDGTYREMFMEINPDPFLSCLCLHNLMKPMKRGEHETDKNGKNKISGGKKK